MEYYDVKKIANAIIFFIDSDVKNLGRTKLMKLFFYADKYHLETYGKSIFSHSYTKLPKGPVPTWIYSIIRTSASGHGDYDFESEVEVFNHYIDATETQNGKYRPTIFTKKQNFDSSFFSKSQLKILTKVANEFKTINATNISELSHDTKAWQSVSMNETISYASMVEDKHISSYIDHTQNEKSSFLKNLQRHKLEQVC